MSTPHDDDPDARDAWLREALRHAPDADAAPPPRVNDTILRMGRAAVATRAPRAAPPPPTWLGRLAAVWSSLARPPVAAGFAGVMVATVVGLMWWNRPLEEALPPREAVVAAAPAPTIAEPPAAAAPAAEQARPAAATARVAAAAKPAEAPTRKAAPIVAPAVAPPPAPAPAPQRDVLAAKSTSAGAAAPAQDEAANQATLRLRESAERRELAAAPAAAAPAPAQAMGRMADAAAPAALAGRAAVASSPIETPALSNLRFEIRRRPDAWTWQRDDGAPRQVDEAFEAWVAQADRTTRPQWQAGSTGSDMASATLRFTRDGVVRAVLRLGPAGMRLTRGGKTESAELARGQAATLLSALDALGP